MKQSREEVRYGGRRFTLPRSARCYLVERLPTPAASVAVELGSIESLALRENAGRSFGEFQPSGGALPEAKATGQRNPNQ
ncbi:MAG TPA: hypothetical protein VN902_15535 [Candidatus Acidoferrales bacterium]|jgi:hypothetical protein|nr:hypothetical protein [Candidatus Acidoferrales bacterium]